MSLSGLNFGVLQYLKNGDATTLEITAAFRIEKKKSNQILRGMAKAGLISRSVWSAPKEILWTVTQEGIDALEAATVRQGGAE